MKDDCLRSSPATVHAALGHEAIRRTPARYDLARRVPMTDIPWIMPADFVEQRVVLTAGELSTGLRMGWITRETAVDLATSKAAAGSPMTHAENDLAATLRDEITRVDDLIDGLAYGDQPTEDRERTWLYLALDWLWPDRQDNATLTAINDLYVLFDYPPSISTLVGWMPLQDGDTLGVAGIRERWDAYLGIERRRLAARDSKTEREPDARSE